MGRIALLSVFEKFGIERFARALVELGFDVYASGGTFEYLTQADVDRRDGQSKINPLNVSTLTGVEPILGHRVVTLHPKIHGGLMGTEEMREEMDEHGIPWIDLVCVDLSPIYDAIDAQDATLESVTAQIDIGGPALLCAAAKGNRLVLCNPDQRGMVLAALSSDRVTSGLLLQLRQAAVKCVARYTTAQAAFLLKEMRKQVLDGASE